jgi:hypothetical protein
MSNTTKEHREQTRTEGACQRCGTKAAQHHVVKDMDKLVAAKRKGMKEGLSHYCAGCADKRVTEKQRWLDRVKAGKAPRPTGRIRDAAKAKRPARRTVAAKR